MRILLAEDNPADARLMREMLLESTGTAFELQTESSLKETLAVLSRQSFDALVLDLGLPDSQGLETLKRAKAVAQDFLPILVLTGMKNEAAGLEALRQGAQDYLTKPDLTPELLARALRYALERHRLGQVLASREAELKDAQRLAHLGNWSWSASENTVLWSEELYRIFGREPSSPPPSFEQNHELYPPESLKRLQEAVTKTLETGLPFELDLEFKHADGTNGWLTTRGKPWADNSGQILGLRGTAQDITERKRAEQALRQSYAELSQFRRFAEGREMRLIELKRRVNELAARLGEPAYYKLSFLQQEDGATTGELSEPIETPLKPIATS